MNSSDLLTLIEKDLTKWNEPWEGIFDWYTEEPVHVKAELDASYGKQPGFEFKDIDFFLENDYEKDNRDFIILCKLKDGRFAGIRNWETGACPSCYDRQIDVFVSDSLEELAMFGLTTGERNVLGLSIQGLDYF